MKNDSSWQIAYLRRCAEYVSEWYSKNPAHCLTQPTSTAVRQTLTAIADLCEKLFEGGDFYYLLLGKLSSDPIEARFGAYRQMAGANYYISCKQLLEAEKKLRIINLIKCHVDFHNFDISTDSVSDLSSESNTDLELVDVSFDDLDSLDEIEQATVYYVAGYIGRSISRRNKCNDCKTILIENDSSELSFVDDKKLIFNDVNRGGLSPPSDFCYTICVASLVFYKQLEEENRRKTFFRCSNQRDVFVSNVLTKLFSILGLKVTFNRCCTSGHIVLTAIIKSVFNCFAKNFKKQLNAPNNEQLKQSRKLLKLKPT